MKKLLTAGTALLLVMGASTQAIAQKAGDNILGEARYTQPERQAVVIQQQPVYQTPPETQIEPAAGDQNKDSWFSDFTGPYVGANVGFGTGTYDISGPANGDVGLDGYNYGLFAGYGFEHRFDVIGAFAAVELGYDWSEEDGSIGTTDFEKDKEWLATFRPGVSFNQDVLGYGILGYSRAEFNTDTGDEDLDGLVLGGGAAFDTNSPFKVRLEYTYTNYEDSNVGTASFDGHESDVKLGALFQF